MSLDDQQIRALTFLACASRPTGARRWDADGTFANIAKVRDRSLPSVIMAVIRAASDRDVDSPGVIPTKGSHWQESAAVTTHVPAVIPAEDRCGICSKHRNRCPLDRIADDDHEFDTGSRTDVDIVRTIAALKAELTGKYVEESA